MTEHYVSLLIGVLCGGIGGEMFVRGSVGLALRGRISPGIIGATVAAFATSSPELSVSVRSALAGTPQIALGDALGSNVVNVALILALPIVISGLRTSRESLRRDFPVACGVPVLTAFLLSDGLLSRLEGILLLGIFLTWIIVTVQAARSGRQTVQAGVDASAAPPDWWRPVLACLVGLAFLFAAGELIVSGASGIATAAGIDAFVIGATVVAVGTSVPELATALIAKLRGHDEIGLGTVLGSNIFNGLFIIGVAATIHPIAVAWNEVDLALLFGLVAVLTALPPKSGWLARRRGAILLLLYAGYLAALLLGVPRAAAE